MAYTKPLAGLCAATALFVCAPNGAPSAPVAVPPANEVDGPVVCNGEAGPLTVASGSKVVVSASGFAGGANVTFTLYSEPTVLAEVVADDSGVATSEVTVAGSGSHTLVALGNDPAGGANVRTTSLTFAGASSDPLPLTGFEIGSVLTASSALVGVGLVLRRAARVKRRPRTS